MAFRKFIVEKLREIVGLRIVGEVSDGLEAVHLARQLKPELIILDIGLPTLGRHQSCSTDSRTLP